MSVQYDNQFSRGVCHVSLGGQRGQGVFGRGPTLINSTSPAVSLRGPKLYLRLCRSYMSAASPAQSPRSPGSPTPLTHAAADISRPGDFTPLTPLVTKGNKKGGQTVEVRGKRRETLEAKRPVLSMSSKCRVKLNRWKKDVGSGITRFRREFSSCSSSCGTNCGLSVPPPAAALPTSVQDRWPLPPSAPSAPPSIPLPAFSFRPSLYPSLYFFFLHPLPHPLSEESETLIE